MKRSLLYVVVLVLITTMIAAFSLYGCKVEEAVAEEEAVEEEAAPAEEVAEEAPAEEETITYWTWVPTDLQWKDYEAAFAEKYPNIKVEFWTGELADYQVKLQVAIAAGEGPDVIGMQAGGMLNQYSEFLLPIKPIADEKWGEDWESKLNPSALEETKSLEGTQTALPINLSGSSLVLYNKAIFDEAGIETIPANYDEWKEVCEIIKAKGYIPVALGAKDIWNIVDIFTTLSSQFGSGEIYQAYAGELSWTDKVFVDTMQAWKKLFDDIAQEGALGVTTYPDAWAYYYAERKSAMLMVGTWHLSYALPGGAKFGTKIENDPTSCFILPQFGPYESRLWASVDTAIAINKDTKNKEAAWKLFSFMTMEEGQQIVADQMQGSPAKKEITPTTLDLFEFQSEKDAVIYANELISNAMGPRLLKYPELNEALGVAMQEVAAGTRSIEVALQDVQDVSSKIER